MKRQTFLVLLLLLVLSVTPALHAQVVETPEDDTTAPLLAEFSFTPTTVDVTHANQVVTVTARVTDNLAGFEWANFYFNGPSGQTVWAYFSTYNRISGDARDGVYKTDVWVPRFSEAGTWTIAWMHLQDVTRNDRYFSTPELVAAGFPVALTVQGQQDLANPQLVSVTAAPTSVNVSSGEARVKLTVRITDDLAGLSGGQIGYASPTGAQYRYAYLGTWQRVSGDELDGIYETELVLPQFTEHGIYRPVSYYLSDAAGRIASVWNWEGVPGIPAIDVTSVPDDIQGPQLTEFSFTPSGLDVSDGPADLTVRIRATENLSGFNWGVVTFISPTSNQYRQGYFWVPWDATRESTLDRVYEATVPFPQYSAAGNWRVQGIQLQDRVGNWRWIDGSELRDRGYDTDVQVSSGLAVEDATATWGGTTTLRATLTSGDNPLPNKTISFKMLGVAAGEAVTDANGVATLATVSVAGIDGGNYFNAIEASFAGDTGVRAVTGAANLVIEKLAQTIEFTAVGTRNVGDAPFALSASASSGLPVAFRLIGGPAWLAGSTVTVTGEGDVTVEAYQNGNGQYAAAAVQQTFKVVSNRPPVASASSNAPQAEGSTVAFTGTFTDPDPGDTHTVLWSFGDGSTSAAGATSHVYAENGTYTATFTVTDAGGLSSSASLSIVVTNAAPVVGAIETSAGPMTIGTSTTASASFSDAGALDSHLATWSWGDGTTSAGTVTESAGAGSVAGSHVYATAGIYTVSVTVTDDDGGATARSFAFVVVVDPDAGFATGGGTLEPGKVSFAFTAKYLRGAPEGSAQIQLHDAGLNFHANGIEWLVVRGATAWAKARGTVGGGGDYDLLLAMHDAETDRLRVRITDRATGAVVYDSQPGAAMDAAPTTAIASGSIVLH